MNGRNPSSLERITFFYHEYLDGKHKYGAKLYPVLGRQCLHDVGIVADDAVQSDGI